MRSWIALTVTLAAVGCTSEAQELETPKAKKLVVISERIAPLHEKLGKPKPGDWLLSHKESGQTFAEYLDDDPTLATGKRRVIYIQPIGPFSKAQEKIVKLSADFMGHYFGLKVTVLETLGLDVIPAKARRIHPSWKVKQILSTYVLDDVLKPRLPKDGAAIIAFTAIDLYPEPSWNFVFGQASLVDRTGVWSIYRNGDPEEEFELCLLRTLKTATHETGHMFSIRHCIAYECNMCGSNNRSESDRRPVTMCPSCLPKLLWATGADAKARFKKLQAFCKKYGLKDEAEYYAAALARLE